MPQIQILGREQTEQKNNLANQAMERQKLVQDTWYKSQMLKYYADELKYKVQASSDEVEKAKMTQKYNDAKLGAEVMTNAYKVAEKMGGKAAQDYLMGVQQQSPQLFAGIMNSGFGEKLSKLQPTGTERLAGSAADMVDQQLGRGQPQAGGAPVNPAVAGQGGGVPEPTNQGRAGAIGGGGLIPSISVGGVNMEFPEQVAASERNKVMARKEAEREVEMQPIRTSVGNYLKVFDAATGELGGLSTNALQALARGKGAEAIAQVGDKPNIFALGKLMEPVSLQLGSYLNRGRPTDRDQEAAKNMLTRITYTKGVNQILRHYLESVANTGNKDLATKLFWSLAKDGGSNSKDAKMYSDPTMFNGSATSRFIIKEKK